MLAAACARAAAGATVPVGSVYPVCWVKRAPGSGATVVLANDDVPPVHTGLPARLPPGLQTPVTVRRKSLMCSRPMSWPATRTPSIPSSVMLPTPPAALTAACASPRTTIGVCNGGAPREDSLTSGYIRLPERRVSHAPLRSTCPRAPWRRGHLARHRRARLRRRTPAVRTRHDGHGDG